jgi:predicted TIM-barrel fold metal-dependent hydrolase
MTSPIRMLQLERPIEDFLAALVGENLFHRHPNLRVASVENGAGFLRGLFTKLRTTAGKMQGWFPEDPVETFRRHIWINPFWEDDVDEVLELMGPDRVLFGSDWPHIEALPEPLHYLRDVAHLPADVQRKVLLENTAELNELRPA